MNKLELIEVLAAKTGVVKKQVEDLLEALTGAITEELKNGREVAITGFGAFSAKQRAAREGVNPRNPSEKIHIPAVKVPKFKAGKALKDALKNQS